MEPTGFGGNGGNGGEVSQHSVTYQVGGYNSGGGTQLAKCTCAPLLPTVLPVVRFKL